MIVCLALGVEGCKRSHTGALHPPAGRDVYDTGPLDGAAFNSNDTIRQRILHMPFGEMAARLGSLRYEAQSNLTLSHGADEYDQADRYVVSQDASGSFHVLLDTPTSQVDMLLIGEDVFVRYDKGHMRQKTRRDTDAETLTDVAVSVLAQNLELFGPPVTFTDPHPDHVDGRAVTRFRVRLHNPAPPAALHAVVPTQTWRLPLRGAPKWRETARPLDVNGSIAVDVQTGVILAADVDGRLEVPEVKNPPTDITTHLTVRLTQIGHVPAIKAPKAVPEFKRVNRNRDPISFFRDIIPIQKADEGPAGKDSK